MGGANKALLKFQGEYLFTYAVANLRPHCQDILVNANDNAEVFADLGHRVIGDGRFLHMGPLAGILAALKAASSDMVLVAACDQLALPAQVYTDLLKYAKSGKGAFASDGQSPFPTCAALPCSLTDTVQECLENAAADSALLRLLPFMRAHCKELVFPSVTFRNINTPEQMDQMEQDAERKEGE